MLYTKWMFSPATSQALETTWTNEQPPLEIRNLVGLNPEGMPMLYPDCPRLLMTLGWTFVMAHLARSTSSPREPETTFHLTRSAVTIPLISDQSRPSVSAIIFESILSRATVPNFVSQLKPILSPKAWNACLTEGYVLISVTDLPIASPVRVSKEISSLRTSRFVSSKRRRLFHTAGTNQRLGSCSGECVRREL